MPVRPRDLADRPDADPASLRAALQDANERIRESEERYRALFDAIDEGYCLCELILDDRGRPADYRFLEVNPLFNEMTGIQPNAVGRTARDLVPGLEDVWVETYGRVALTGEPLRFEQGSAVMGREFDVYVTRVGPPEKLQFAIVFKDVTERKRIERSLHGIIEQAIAGVAQTDPSGRFTLVNDRYCEIVGRTRDDLLSMTMQQITHQHDLPRNLELFSALVTDGIPFEIEKRYVRPDGSEVWVQNSVSPLRDTTGQTIGVIAISIDVTERRRTADALNRAVSVKDEFLGLVSHELRTPITTVLGNAEVLTRRGDTLDAAERAAALADIKSSAERLDRIIKDLLTVARAEQGALELEPLVIGRVTREIVADYASGSRMEITIHGDDTDAICSGEQGVLSQVLRNYLSNAEKYGEGSPVEVRVTPREHDVAILVLDRGRGINPDEADALFDAFFRSRDVGPVGGMGIGLSVCKRLAEAIGGRVWGKPRDGGGSEFGVSVPLYRDE
jgi:PAS domain S-box-containing protein